MIQFPGGNEVEVKAHFTKSGLITTQDTAHSTYSSYSDKRVDKKQHTRCVLLVLKCKMEKKKI